MLWKGAGKMGNRTDFCPSTVYTFVHGVWSLYKSRVQIGRRVEALPITTNQPIHSRNGMVLTVPIYLPVGESSRTGRSGTIDPDGRTGIRDGGVDAEACGGDHVTIMWHPASANNMRHFKTPLTVWSSNWPRHHVWEKILTIKQPVWVQCVYLRVTQCQNQTRLRYGQRSRIPIWRNRTTFYSDIAPEPEW